MPAPLPRASLISQLTRLAARALSEGELVAECLSEGDAKRLRQQFYSARKHLSERGTTESPLFEIEFTIEGAKLKLRPQGSSLSDISFRAPSGEEFRLAPLKALSPADEEAIFKIECELAERLGPGDYHQQAKEIYHNRVLHRD